MNRILTTLIVLLSLGTSTALAQTTGGHSPGQAAPSGTAKAGLDAGPMGENVNYFTGDLSFKYALGRISTLSGLSYPLELQYESNTYTAFEAPHNSGIPYGEGWSISSAFITMESFAYDYIQSDSLGYNPDLGRKYTIHETQKRGEMYFANPTIHLPGGISGRLVYKYPDKTDPYTAVYHLHQFDHYIEARFGGDQWLVTLDDGTRYRFGLAQYRERAPTELTANLAVNNIRSTVPKREVLRWHLTEIYNPNHANGQKIILDYQQFGEIELNAELQQARVNDYIDHNRPLIDILVWTQALLDTARAHGNTPTHPNGDLIVAGDTTFNYDSVLEQQTAWKDVFLTAVTALDAQGAEMGRAELKYHSWQPEIELAGDPRAMARGNFLLLSDPQVVRRDSLYSQKTVWFSGTDRLESQTLHGQRPAQINQAFTNAWRRYMHPRANQHPFSSLQYTHDPLNPYLIRMPYSASGNRPAGLYWVNSPAISGQPIGALPFTHSVLESPRINLQSLPSGEWYELRSLIQCDPNLPSWDMNFDLRIGTGLKPSLNPRPRYNQGSTELVLADQLSGPQGYFEKGYNIFSTLPKIIKWNPEYFNSEGWLATRNAFYMPNLPNEFGGFVIQVGPGADNMHYGKTNDLRHGYPAFYNNRDNLNNPVPRDSFELKIGKWFGTGAPLEALWRTNRYSVYKQDQLWTKGQHFMRNYWWYLDKDFTYNGYQLAQQGPNQPTAVTQEFLKYPLLNPSYSFSTNSMLNAHEAPLDAQLWNMELVRIGKNPLMLDSVVFYVCNGAYGIDRIAEKAYKFEYSLAQVPVLNNLNPNADANIVGFPNDYKRIGADTMWRNIWQLAAIRELEVDSNGIVGNPAGFSKFGYYPENLNTPLITEAVLLKQVENMLGGKTSYVYNFSNIKTDHVNENPLGLYNDQSNEIIGSGAMFEQRIPIARKIVEDGNTQLVTDYTFSNPVQLNRGYTIDAHFGRGWNTYPKVNRVWGYALAIVQGPALNTGQRIKTFYRYLSDTATVQDKLLFGRLYETLELDGNGVQATKKTIHYGASLAYKNGNSYHQPALLSSNGLQVGTNGGNRLLSYEHAYLWQEPAQAWLMQSWFTRVDSVVEIETDPISGRHITRRSQNTYYDWDANRDDTNGDYAEMYRYQLPGANVFTDEPWFDLSNGRFSYGPEPSWQIASTRMSSPDMPGAYHEKRYYYLWDIGPFLTGHSVLADRHIGSHRPYWLAQHWGVRNTVVEEQTLTHNGEKKAKALSHSTYYHYDVFRDVPGDFIVKEDRSNYGSICSPGNGGPIETYRQSVTYCFGTGSRDSSALQGKEALAAYLDDPTLIQLQNGDWWRFPVKTYSAITATAFDAMAMQDVTAQPSGCAAGFVTGTEGQIKYFGTLDLGSAGAAPVSLIQNPTRNYGTLAADSLNPISNEKVAPLLFLPHKHDQIVPCANAQGYCDMVHGFTNDSLMTLAADNAKENPGDGSVERQNFVDMLDWQYFLRAVYTQCDSVPNYYTIPDSVHNQAFPSPHNVWDTLNTGNNWQSTPYRYVFRPPYAVIRNYMVHTRNMHGLVLDESDARHLHQLFEYNKGLYHYWYDSCGTPHSAIARYEPWLPQSITITDFGLIEQTTRFDYQRNMALRKTFLPNGEVLEARYDKRHRLAAQYLNGDLLTEYKYSNWNGNAANWQSRTGQNYVETMHVIDLQDRFYERHYVDPLGREEQAFIAIKDGQGWHKRFKGDEVRDSWSRVQIARKTYDKRNQPNLNYDPNTPINAFAALRYEPSTRGSVLRASKPGNNINGNHVMQHNDRVITVAQFRQETGLNWQTIQKMWPGLSINMAAAIQLYRSEDIDEDGRKSITFQNVEGQHLASLGFTDAAQTVPTLTYTLYDIQGDPVELVNALGQKTTIKYNFLGWPYQKTSADEGTLKMYYNQAGDLRYVQDENLRAKQRYHAFEYDRLGRLVREKELGLQPAQNGLFTYYPLYYRDTTNFPFRSVHTIHDELQLNLDEDFNTANYPYTWHYLDLSFPQLQWPEYAVKLRNEYRYDYATWANVTNPALPAIAFNLLAPAADLQLNQGQRHVNGRLTAHKAYNENGQLIELTFPDYDYEGRLARLIKQFEAQGIQAGQVGKARMLSYPAYNRLGMPLRTEIDLHCDGTADLSQLYEYDKWGRLETLKIAHKKGEDLLTRYQYDDATGLLHRQINFAAADSAGHCPTALAADTLTYSYDIQDRMTYMRSYYLDFGLFYDAQNVNYDYGTANPTGNQIVRTSQNWAGGINGWQAKYKVAADGVTGFNGRTVYGFAYDGMGRLTEADAAIMEQPFGNGAGWYGGGGFGVPVLTTRKAWYGDARYEYDAIGNLKGLKRYKYYAPNTPTTGLKADNWKYDYFAGTNRLKRLRTAGQQNINFSYDGNGNLLTDSQKGIQVTAMGGNNLPTAMSINGAQTRYLYAGGSRVFKATATNSEYYLRDAGGTPLAIWSEADSNWTFQLYGLGMIGELSMKEPARDTTSGPSPLRTQKSKFTPLRWMRDFALASVVALQQNLHQKEGKTIGNLGFSIVPLTLTIVDALADAMQPEAMPNVERSSRDSLAYPAVKFFVTDHLGNVRVAYMPTINDTTCLLQREVLAVLDYYPYGKILRSWTSDPQRWQSTGNERDTETAWDYRGARLYDADYGRFLSVDPLAAKFLSWSPYNYVNGKPTGLTDVTGLEPDGGGGGTGGRHPEFPDNADASTTVEFYGKTYVKVSYGHNRFVWKVAQGTTITAKVEKGIVSKAIEKFGYGMGRLAYEVCPGVSIVKMATGKEKVTAMNIAFAAFELVPGGGSSGKAGKAIGKEILEEGLEQVVKHGDEVVDGLKNIPYVVQEIEGFYVRSKQWLANGTYTRQIQSLANLRENNSLVRLVQAFELEAKAMGAKNVVLSGVDIVNSKLFNPQIAERFGYTYRRLSENSFEISKALK